MGIYLQNAHKTRGKTMNKIIKPLAIATSILATSSAFALETERELTLDTKGLQEVLVDTGAGSLTVKGQTGLDRIKVSAEIIVDGVDDDEAQEWLEDYMDLSVRNENGKAIVCARFGYQKNADCSAKKRLKNSWFGWNSERKINLTVYVPANLALEVDDGSGHTEISDIQADTFVDDGSGHITVTNIQGNLTLDDGSGDLTVEKVTGDIFIDDGSGSIKIDQVTGEVKIEDGSGGIKVTNITKEVYIDDGSGSISACHLGDDLTVDDGSGSVDTCEDIKGKVTIK